MQYQKDTGYPALEKMQRRNADKYKKVIEKLDVDNPLPYIPPVHTWRRTSNGGKPIDKTDMEFCAVDFIRHRCEGLGYDLEDIRLDDLNGDSAGRGQIPKAMEWDINRLCLENAIHVFVESGLAEDAFDIYFCYLEMFIGEYSNSGKLIEQVAEFEQNASSLLMKHRDHYSHSVYVFLIGLAIYDTNPAYRNAFENFYGIKNEHEAAYKFLEFWGLTALFHDTGYPFEIPYEQVKAYFTKSELIGERNSDDDQKNWPFLSYQNMDWFIDLDSFDAKSSLWNDLMPDGYKDSKQETVDDILAANVAYRLEKHYSNYDKFRKYSQNSGASYTDYMSSEILGNKPGHPERFNDFMDHGYWSATILFSQLVNILDEDKIRKNSQMYMDSLTAVLLHNSIYKFCVTCYKDNKEFKDGLRAEWHPLAFLLFLCDELQAWDRTAYGQNSRSEVHAMDCDFEFKGKTVIAKYVVDKKLKDKVGAKIEGNEKFQKDIEMILYINKDDTDSESVLTLDCDTIYRGNDRYRKRYLSNSNYIHLFDFALILNERYRHSQKNGQSTADFIRELEDIKREDMLKNFEGMSLEYKLSNIKQAKGFARYLDKIGCFYTDSPVDFEILDRFNEQELALIGPMENNRWLKEKAYLGWSPNCIGISYADHSITASELDEKIKEDFKGDKKEYKKFREQTRCHNLMVPVRYDQNGMPVFIHGKDTERHYDLLSPYDKSLDREPMNVIFHLMNNFDGLRIYRYRDGK
ncbi:MAG: hypothetical protein ACI4CX_08875 [Candidatus Weimeria sp.]